jgi:hypothetical protein
MIRVFVQRWSWWAQGNSFLVGLVVDVFWWLFWAKTCLVVPRGNTWSFVRHSRHDNVFEVSVSWVAHESIAGTTLGLVRESPLVVSLQSLCWSWTVGSSWNFLLMFGRGTHLGRNVGFKGCLMQSPTSHELFVACLSDNIHNIRTVNFTNWCPYWSISCRSAIKRLETTDLLIYWLLGLQSRISVVHVQGLQELVVILLVIDRSCVPVTERLILMETSLTTHKIWILLLSGIQVVVPLILRVVSLTRYHLRHRRDSASIQ